MIKRIADKFIADSWDEMGIEIPPNKAYSQLDIKIKNCPVCIEEGKKNDSSLSVKPVQGVGKCHKCGTKYVIRKKQDTERVVTKKEWTPPSRKNMTKLSSQGLQYIINRKITQEAINRCKLVEEVNEYGKTEIAFPYFLDTVLVNVKYRNILSKTFRQSTNGMHVLFNYDNAVEYMESSGDFSVVLTEGEFDAMSFESQGIHYAVSVDSGAPNEKDTKVDGKLECIDNCMHIFDLAEIVYIAVDNDANGRRLKDELCRRIDIEKIRVVNWGNYKDANEALMYDEKLQDYLDSAKEIKLEGVFYAEDVYDKLDDLYENGLAKGTTTHLPSLDRHWTWRLSEVNLWTGYQNEGKSTFLYHLALLKAVFDGWSFALFTPENFPAEEFYEDMIHAYVGKTTDHTVPGRMTKAEFQEGKDFMNRHFFLMYPEDNASMESILERAKYLVKKKGIRGLIIDPYNTIEHDMQGLREDLYISKIMGRLKKFSVENQLSSHLVAHQNKPEKLQDNGNYPAPDPYRVKGGGTFVDKVDNALSLWRPFRKTDSNNPLVTIEAHKIKKKKLTGVTGDFDISFDWKTNRYIDHQLKKSPLEIKLAMK